MPFSFSEIIELYTECFTYSQYNFHLKLHGTYYFIETYPSLYLY